MATAQPESLRRDSHFKDGGQISPVLRAVIKPGRGGRYGNARPLPLTHFDQILLAILATALLALTIAYWIRLTHWGAHPIEIERLPAKSYEFRLDINSATWVEFSQLEGIGDALARRIVADREANGPFESLEHLRRVRGIGSKTLERIRPWLEATAPDGQPPHRGPQRQW